MDGITIEVRETEAGFYGYAVLPFGFNRRGPFQTREEAEAGGEEAAEEMRRAWRGD